MPYTVPGFAPTPDSRAGARFDNVAIARGSEVAADIDALAQITGYSLADGGAFRRRLVAMVRAGQIAPRFDPRARLPRSRSDVGRPRDLQPENRVSATTACQRSCDRVGDRRGPGRSVNRLDRCPELGRTRREPLLCRTPRGTRRGASRQARKSLRVKAAGRRRRRSPVRRTGGRAALREGWLDCTVARRVSGRPLGCRRRPLPSPCRATTRVSRSSGRGVCSCGARWHERMLGRRGLARRSHRVRRMQEAGARPTSAHPRALAGCRPSGRHTFSRVRCPRVGLIISTPRKRSPPLRARSPKRDQRPLRDEAARARRRQRARRSNHRRRTNGIVRGPFVHTPLGGRGRTGRYSRVDADRGPPGGFERTETAPLPLIRPQQNSNPTGYRLLSSCKSSRCPP